MKAIALLVCSFLLFTAACSSSSSSPKAECFTGAFNVVFAAEANGNAQCPDLTAKPTQWVYIESDGKLIGPEPKGTTPATYSADESTCALRTEFKTATPAAGCNLVDSYLYDLTFNATALTGTYQFIGCIGSDPDAGAAVEFLNCTYPVTGTKVQ